MKIWICPVQEIGDLYCHLVNRLVWNHNKVTCVFLSCGCPFDEEDSRTQMHKDSLFFGIPRGYIDFPVSGHYGFRAVRRSSPTCTHSFLYFSSVSRICTCVCVCVRGHRMISLSETC